MINSMNPTTRDAALDALATHLITAHDDFPTTILHIAPLLNDYDLIDLCARTDLCPMHLCDIDICADDNELACAEFRA